MQAGKEDDVAYYAEVCTAAEAAGLTVAEGVDFYIQYGSGHVKDLAVREGWHDLFGRVGVKLIDPGCGACIGAGPGVSTDAKQVTVSAINRNFQGRSGPGRLYLASPLTVARVPSRAKSPPGETTSLRESNPVLHEPSVRPVHRSRPDVIRTEEDLRTVLA